MEQHSRSLPALPVPFSFPAVAEKAVEEKEKDKETRDETEATDAKDKTEAADVKKGTSHCPRWRATVTARSKHQCFCCISQ